MAATGNRRPGQRVDIDPEDLAKQAATPRDRATAELLRSLPLQVVNRRVIGEQMAAEFMNLSYAHVRDMRQQGTGPAWIRLNDRRIGYRVCDLMDWCEARMRGGSARKRMHDLEPVA